MYRKRLAILMVAWSSPDRGGSTSKVCKRSSENWNVTADVREPCVRLSTSSASRPQYRASATSVADARNTIELATPLFCRLCWANDTDGCESSLAQTRLKLNDKGTVKLPLPQNISNRSVDAKKELEVQSIANCSILVHTLALGCEKLSAACRQTQVLDPCRVSFSSTQGCPITICWPRERPTKETEPRLAESFCASDCHVASNAL